MDNLETFLMDYEVYAGMFSKQIYNKDLWQEQTGCDVDEYFGYIACCETKLYEFSTWYEHTTGKSYPTNPAWEARRHFKHALLAFHS